MKFGTKRLGDYGERIACCFLKKKGYKILERNYTKKWSRDFKGEIDIIAQRNGAICFVEVKTIAPAESGGYFAEDKVDFRKRKKLLKIAQIWLSEKKIPLDSKWQIDIISLEVGLNAKKAKIKHFQNAVSL